MRHFLIADGMLALVLVLALGWLFLDTPPAAAPTRAELCGEIFALREQVDQAEQVQDPLRITEDARNFIASTSDAELALLHETPARFLRDGQTIISTASASEVWAVMGVAELECRGIEWGRPWA